MRKRIIGALLVLMLFASVICVSAVSAADTTQIKLGEVSVKPGEQVEVPVTITGNPGIAGFRFWVEYDMEALTLVSVEKGDALTSGTLKFNVDSVDTTITWFALTDVTGNGELMTLTFDISENAIGDYPLTVTYDPEDIVNASWQQVDCAVADGKIMVENLSGLQYVVENNQVTITGYTGNGGNLIIPKTIGGLPVTSIGNGAFWGCTSLTSITIPDSVTSIGNYAFWGCTSLTSITIPDSVTSIGRGAFSDCIGLTSISIPDSVTSIGYSAFSGCTGLTHIVIPDSVICIQEEAFKNCTGLVSIIIPNSVTEIGSIAFENCSSLTCVVIPNSVTWIGEGTFDNCTSLTSVIYCGTQDQWDSIDISSANSSLFNGTLQFHNIENGVCTICGYKPLYTVTFKDWNNAILSSKTYYWGDAVTAPTNPTKAADNTYAYTFAGWDKAVVDCAGDATYTATYTSAYINYIVVFKNWNGDVLSTKTYHWGDQVTAPANPTKAADKTYTYTFAGWDKTVVNCAGGATYTATYTPAYIDYTVTFKNWDGSVLASDQYHYNDTVKEPSTPARPEDNTYEYVFKGWDSAIVKVVGNKIYTAVYDAIKKIVEITSNAFNVQGSSIGKVGTGTSINTFVSKLSQSGSVKVYKGNTQVSGNTAIGTGMEVKLMDGNTVVKSYTVVVTGDTNGDGAISVTDMIAIKAHVLKKTLLTGAYAEAGDTSNDNAISITDFIQVKAQILGKSSIVPN